MFRGQSSLEYLILIAAVIAIASISVVMLSGSTSSTSQSLAISSCKQAATECAASKFVSPDDPCLKCETACSGADGEVFAGAILLCKQGNSSQIYSGNPGTSCGDTVCNDSSKGGTETCSNCPSDCGVCPVSTCSDSTANNSCSSSKPEFCLNGVLFDDCVSCGCNSGQSCNVTSKACYTPASSTPNYYYMFQAAMS